MRCWPADPHLGGPKMMHHQCIKHPRCMQKIIIRAPRCAPTKRKTPDKVSQTNVVATLETPGSESPFRATAPETVPPARTSTYHNTQITSLHPHQHPQHFQNRQIQLSNLINHQRRTLDESNNDTTTQHCLRHRPSNAATHILPQFLRGKFTKIIFKSSGTVVDFIFA
jgi:hypothetical protein